MLRAPDGEAPALMNTPDCQQTLRLPQIHIRPTTQPGHLGAAPGELLKLMVDGENAFRDASEAFTSSNKLRRANRYNACQQQVTAGALKAYTGADVTAPYTTALGVFTAINENASPKALQDVPLALECPVESGIEHGHSSIITMQAIKLAHPTRFERVTSAFGGPHLGVFPELPEFARKG
jgi:hypothetical protein